MRWTPLILAALTPLLVMEAVHADRIDSARLSLDIANHNLWLATRDLDDARRALDLAIADHNAAVDRARSLEAQVASMDVILNDRASLDRLAADAQAAAGREAEIAVALKAAQSNYDQAAAAVDQARSQARGAFEANAEYGVMIGAVRAGEQQLAEANRAANAQLVIDPQYLRLAQRADSIEATLKTMREDPTTPQEAIAQASSDWMAAESALGTFKQQWLEHDRGILDARAQLDRAQRQQQAMEQRFDASLAADPVYRDLLDARNAVQHKIAQISVDLNQARSDRAAIEQNLASAQARFNDANLNFAAAQQDLAIAQAQAADSATRINTLGVSVRAAEECVSRAIWQRDLAARDYEWAVRDRDWDRDDHRDFNGNGSDEIRRREIERRERERRDRDEDFRRQEQADRDRRERDRQQADQQRKDEERLQQEIARRDRERQDREADFRRQREQQEARDRQAREATEARQREDARREQQQARQKQEEETRRRVEEQRQREDDARRKQADDQARQDRQRQADDRNRAESERRKQHDSDENDRGKRYPR